MRVYFKLRCSSWYWSITPLWSLFFTGLKVDMQVEYGCLSHRCLFSDADLQRLTWNDYYGENCFKGGVWTLPGGLHGTYTLWPGAVSDSDYNRRAGYMDEQQEFQNKDTVGGEVKPFVNIYDKGYRAKMAAWKAGKQKVLQPDWANSDRRFNRTETLGSASVASDRGGNERSVNI